MKYILHVDMNAFFASVEELQNPDYQNKPIAVGGHGMRSVISTANYIARAYGVKAAMPMYMAKKLCKDIIFVPLHFHLYEEYSNKFMDLICEKFTNQIEVSSIDECYVDITNLVTKNRSPLLIAKQIQNSIKKNIGLKCSIGVANNKFLAKMGSDYKKPMGITTMWPNELENKLWPQPIDNMLFIGKSTVRLLEHHGIKTIGDIAAEKNKTLLENLLDKNWIVHYAHANGQGNDEIDTSQNIHKTITASTTFLADTNDFDEIKETIIDLTHDVMHRLNEDEQIAKTISVQIKYPNFKTTNRSMTLNEYTDSREVIFSTIMNIYQTHFINKTIRLVGIGLSNLELKEQVNQRHSPLFDDYQEPVVKSKIQKDLMADLVESINAKFSRNIAHIAKHKLTK